MRTIYSRSYSLGFVSGARSTRTMWRISVIRCMHWINQCKGSLREPTRGTWSCRSCTRRIRNNGCSRCSQWSYFEQMRSDSLLCDAQPPHSPHHHTSEDDDDISDIDDDQYPQFLGFFFLRIVLWHVQLYFISSIIDSFILIDSLYFLYFIIFLIIWICE